MRIQKSNCSSILALLLSFAMAFQGEAVAEPAVVSSFVSMIIRARVTTHPDYYTTRLPLVVASPVITDMDADGVLEIVGGGYNAGTGRTNVFVWNRDGTVKPGWPIEVNGEIADMPAVGDLEGDGDGDLAVVVSVALDGGGRVYAWGHDGRIIPGYPRDLSYSPGSPVVADVSGGFSEEVLVYNTDVSACDMDMDGKKEIIRASVTQVIVENGDGTPVSGWPKDLVDAASVGTPVCGDVDYDGLPEIFLAVRRSDGNFIYGWYSDGTVITGWPVNIGDIVNTPGDFLAIADIGESKYCEILTGSTNGWIAAVRLDGTVVFSRRDGVSEIYQPIAGDIDNDGDMEILATSRGGNIYCYDHLGNPVTGWPYTITAELAPGIVLVDIDSDTTGDSLNPFNDMELLFSANDGQVYSIDLPGDFHPNDIQWGMHGFNPRNSGNYLTDWGTIGWSVFDNKPEGAKIKSVYDWNRGGRVIELHGAGLNNCYAYKNPDGSYLNSRNTQMQWSMRYNLDFAIYVSMDTIQGRRFLYYTPTVGDMLNSTGYGGKYIHHGLGNIKDGKWHTMSRDLFRDLRDAEPDNKIVDINAFYIQGSGRIDDLMFIPGAETARLANYAYYADEVRVSSGDATRRNINDNDPDTVWISDAEHSPLVQYVWNKAIAQINKITIENVHGARGGRIFVVHSDGSSDEIIFTLTSSLNEIVFEPIEDVVSLVVIFDTGGSVSVGEIGVYYDPNYVEDSVVPTEYSTDNYIQIRHGYFWDPLKNERRGGYFVPHGISYQTWNKVLGQWQSPAQIRNDLDTMRNMGVNAIRVDFVWKHIEADDDVFDWTNYDMFLEEAQARGMKVFPIIGYQWPPEWFPEEWYTMHPQNEVHPSRPWLSDIISYEDPDTRAEFTEFLQAAASRYSVGGAREDLSDTVAGWILGNEYGYLGLWSVEYDGYDPDCQRAFREWLETKYSGDISALNARWAKDNIDTPGYLPGHPYFSFSDVDMPIPFGYSGETRGRYLARDKASWYDLTQWREESISNFVALAASAVRSVDPSHLISYAAVGMQWGEQDWRYHTEDAAKIARACNDSGTPLNFWSINNYPWGMENDELMTGKWGIERARHDTGLPVMVTETGFTDTETMYDGVDEARQAKLVRNAMWEALESGAMGVCVFHWSDRDILGLTERERGFGIVDTGGNPKPAYYAIRDVFRKMNEIRVGELLPQFIEPDKDIAFLWDDATDSIVNRYEAEMHQLFGTLERLGFNPTFINRDEMLRGDYLSYQAIVLPRNQKMFGDVLDLLPVIALSGVKLHADCDLPGIMDEYGNTRNTDSDWLLMLHDLFGIDTTLSSLQIDPNLEDGDFLRYGYYETGSFLFNYNARRLYSSLLGYNAIINMWKYRNQIIAGTGTVLARFDNGSGNPALIVNDYIGGVEYDTAISLFSLGDSKPEGNPLGVADWTWTDRYNWMRLIYVNRDFGFNLTPSLEMTGSPLVLVDYRATPDTSRVLLGFKNYSPDTTETVQVTSPMFLGKTVEDILNAITVEDPCDGTLECTLEPDGHKLLLAHPRGSGDTGTDTGRDSGTDSGSSSDSGSGADGSSGSDSGSGTGTGSDTGIGSGSGGSDSGVSAVSSSGTSSPYALSTQGTSVSDSSTSISASAPPAVSSGSTSLTAGNPIGGTSTTGSSSSTLGPATIVILDKEKDKKADLENNSQIQNSKTEEGDKHSSLRTYIGNGNNDSSKEPREIKELYSEEGIPEYIPPFEQFAQAVNQPNYEVPGILKVVPEKVTKEHMEEVIHAKPEIKAPDIPVWLKKIIQWLVDKINRLRK